MTSSYTGLYVQRLENGDIHSVQVVDTGGNSIPLDPQVYVDRGVLPPIGTLPDQEDYVKSQP
ncbi:hypothetical protein [Variovorax sp. RCC_210]|uniref:hypothetical protein n=1 Tax=Variovorax sp. RCC_210 TaxID=3239217 RepID=UPI003524C3A1